MINTVYNLVKSPQQHTLLLYVVSDEPIVVGKDMVMNVAMLQRDEDPRISIAQNNTTQNNNGWMKIIATTDKNYALPRLEEKFINTYLREGGRINKVMLAKELKRECWDAHNFGDSWGAEHYDVLVENNCVIVEHYTENGFKQY